MNPVRRMSALMSLLTAVVLTGCQQQEPPTAVESIRAIKTVTLADPVQAIEQRSFPGLVRAANASALSFEVAGKVLEIAVDVGDRVETGQRLAAIDDEAFKLEVQARWVHAPRP